MAGFLRNRSYRGSVTIFLSMSLSSFLLVTTLLIRLCIVNAEKERFEIASDISLNSALGEYEKNLYERYGLLYIDASYLGRAPSVDNTALQIRLYMLRNTEEVYAKGNSPWGRLSVGSVGIEACRTAAYEGGGSMRSQANHYVQDSPGASGYLPEVAEALPFAEAAAALESADPFGEWSAVMEEIAAKERPVVREEIPPGSPDASGGRDGTSGNKSGDEGDVIEREVEVANPADWVYGLSGSDILYTAGLDPGGLSGALIDTGNLISNRGGAFKGIPGRGMDSGSLDRDTLTFLAYLVDKMGCYGNENEASLLKCELEYIISGKESDYLNFRAVAERIFLIRFADNIRLAFSDGGLRGEALGAAKLLEVCTYDASFIDPIATSILFACAYLETLSDMHAIYHDGRIPVMKDSHHMSVNAVLNGTRYLAGGGDGLSYRQYLILFLGMMEEGLLNFRTMDLMELEIRKMSANGSFRMDYCIERINASVTGRGSGIGEYRVNRTYGYY